MIEIYVTYAPVITVVEIVASAIWLYWLWPHGQFRE